MKKMLWSLLAAILFFTCCEGAARIAYLVVFHSPYSAAQLQNRIHEIIEKRSAKENNENGASGRIHPYYGFAARDDRHLPARRELADLTASQLGFTGDTPLFDPSGKTFLAVITGGSVAHYFATDKRRELLAWLEKLPEFSGRTGRLLDTALPGYKQPQQLLILSDLLALGVRPDVVINIDGFNEVCIARKALEVGGYPFLPWFWGNDDKPSRLRLRELGRLEFLESLRAKGSALVSHLPILPAFIGFPAAALDKLIGNRIGAVETALAKENTTHDPLASQRVSPDGGYYMGPNVVIPLGRFAAMAAGQWARASILIHDMVQVAGGRYFHILQPAEPLWAVSRGEAAGPLCPESCVEAGYPVFIRYGQALANAGMRFAFLGPTMTSVGDAFKDCCHVTPAGQDALFAAVTAFLGRSWNTTAPAIDPETVLGMLDKAPLPPFSGADLFTVPPPDTVVVENLHDVEKSAEGPYRTAFGKETVVDLPLVREQSLTVSFGLKNPLPGQRVTVRLNGKVLGQFPLDNPVDHLEKKLKATFVSGLNTLSFAFAKSNSGQDLNKNMPKNYAAQFTVLSLLPLQNN